MRRYSVMTFGLVLFLVRVSAFGASNRGWVFTQSDDRLVITHSDGPVAEFVFKDERILRPYFANLHAPGGVQVTRNFPPLKGVDSTDHDTMHPGLWLAFGDIEGTDFWRNEGRMEHDRFTISPAVHKETLAFATECRLLSPDGDHLCTLSNRYSFMGL